MAKHAFLYLVAFLLLVFLNLRISSFLQAQHSKEENIKRILGEIAESKESVDQFSLSSSPFSNSGLKAESKLADGRAANLKSFFRNHNSPLYDYAELIVEVSDKHKFDYRLLAAIAMQESSLCKYIPPDSNNCWGWGIYGNTVTRFSSYEEAIETVAGGIKSDYIDRGLLTASAIMSRYTPSSNGSWANSVNHFLRLLE